MSFELMSVVDVIEVMENYLSRVRPPEHVRERLDVGYEIEDQSVIIQEIRPAFQNPTQMLRHAFAKATFVKGSKKWKVYWMRSNGKWERYEPEPDVDRLEAFLALVEEDKFNCFRG